MKKLRIASLLLLAVTVFVSVDLGLNFMHSLIPADGIGCSSILHGLFGIFGDHSWSYVRFFHAFEISAWIMFAVFVWNIMLMITCGIK